MMHNGRSGKQVREMDVHLMRLLDYTPEQAVRLASGKAEDMDYHAAARRATRFMVGSTATMPQKSPLRNTRAYRFLVPFTSYFSNRFRQFDQHVRLLKEAGKNATENPSGENLKKLSVASYQSAKFLVGVEMAGIAASMIYAGLREGPAGLETRYHEAIESSRRGWLGVPWGFLGDSFVYGSFGPVYGMFYDTLVRSSQSESRVEETWMRASRAFLPFSLITDVAMAIKGEGPYKDRSPGERFGRFWKLHTPILNTMPAAWVGGMIGLKVTDPRFLAAHRAYWRYVLEPRNQVVPDFTQRGSKQQGQLQYYRGMRRAKEALFKGSNPYPDIIQAFADAGFQGNIAEHIRSWKYLDPKSNPKLTDAKRREILRTIGPRAYNELDRMDRVLEQVALTMDPLGEMGGDIKSQIRYMQNLQYTATHP
jgi:hypothetical protein